MTVVVEAVVVFASTVAATATAYTARKAQQIARQTAANERRSRENREYLVGDPDEMPAPIIERVQSNERELAELRRKHRKENRKHGT